MSKQHLHLRWNLYQHNYNSMISMFLNTGLLVDVTLVAERKQLQVHKVVLSAGSIYFQNLFAANRSHHPIVILNDVTYDDLRIIVDFMYYGEVNVSQEQFPQILKTAKLLKIKGMAEMPETPLNNMQVDTPSSETSDGLADGSDIVINKMQVGAPSVRTSEAEKRSSNNTSPKPNKKRRKVNGAARVCSLPSPKKKPMYDNKNSEENGHIDVTNNQETTTVPKTQPPIQVIMTQRLDRPTQDPPPPPPQARAPTKQIIILVNFVNKIN